MPRGRQSAWETCARGHVVRRWARPWRRARCRHVAEHSRASTRAVAGSGVRHTTQRRASSLDAASLPANSSRAGPGVRDQSHTSQTWFSAQTQQSCQEGPFGQIEGLALGNMAVCMAVCRNRDFRTKLKLLFRRRNFCADYMCINQIGSKPWLLTKMSCCPSLVSRTAENVDSQLNSNNLRPAPTRNGPL